MSQESIPKENKIKVNGIEFSHQDFFNVVDDFYTRIQNDPVLQVPFRSVGDWPEHIQKLTHFWWVKFGGAPYLFNYYNPVEKHFFAGFNDELLERWLRIFRETLNTHLTQDQAALWTLISERMGHALSLKNDLYRVAYEQRNSGANAGKPNGTK